MELINRSIFLETFDKLRSRKVMSANRLAVNSGLSQSYVYLLLSQAKILSQAKSDNKGKSSKRSRKSISKDLKEIPKGLQKSTAKKLCHGLNLTAKQTATILHNAGDTASHRQAKFSVPKYVKRLMKKQNLSSNQLADKSGLNDHRLKDFLNNGSHFSKVSLIKLSRGLGLNANALVRHYIPQSEPTTLSLPSDIMKPTPKKRTKSATKPRRKKTEKPSKTRKTSKPNKSHKATRKSGKKKVPIAHKAIDTFNVTKSNTTEAPKKILRPEVLDLARYINYNLSDTQIAVLRLLVEQMRH